MSRTVLQKSYFWLDSVDGILISLVIRFKVVLKIPSESKVAIAIGAASFSMRFFKSLP